jgi:hypothetical protein
MPERVMPSTLEGSGRRILSWPEYGREEPAVFQAVIMDHFDRHRDRGLDLELRGGTLRLEMEDETDEAERKHSYLLDEDGAFTSIVDSDLMEVQPDDEVARHERITEDRFSALYGRAVKADDVAQYIESFEDYGVSDAVLDRFRDGPVLEPGELEDAIAGAYDDERAEAVPDELYERVGTVELAGDDYLEALDDLLEDDEAREEIDTEMYTKGRSLEDVKADTKYGEEMAEIYDNVMDFVTVRFNE